MEWTVVHWRIRVSRVDATLVPARQTAAGDREALQLQRAQALSVQERALASRRDAMHRAWQWQGRL